MDGGGGGRSSTEIGERPLLPEMSSSNGQQMASQEDGNKSGIKNKPFNWKAPAIVLGFELLESIAFSGIALNLVVYLGTVLHGTIAFNAAHVDTWNGTTFIVPVIGAFLADSYWGKYKTISVSLVFYLLGMLLITVSAALPSLRPASCQGASCPPATGTQFSIFFLALYLVSIGTGGVKSALLPFGADQYDDGNPKESQKKQSFFSWFFAAINLGIFIAGTLVSWIEQNVAWALGFGISASCLTIAAVGFFAGTPMYRVQLPEGSPLKSLVRVFVVSFKKRRLALDNAVLYESDDKNSHKLAHTKGFRFLDKAAVKDVESSEVGPWRLCTVTEVEELKILIRMLPIWVTCVFYAASLGQMTTTFIQQGMAMDTKLGTLSVPVASLVSVDVVCMLAWVLLHDMAVMPLAKKCLRNNTGLSQLQRMGVGRFLVILSLATAALVEARRLRAAGDGRRISIAWQVPQFVILAGSDVFSGIAQLEFFYGEAPETMRSICSAFSFLAMSLGFYANSLVVTVVAAVTKTRGRPGWLPVDLNAGHLDYYFWLWAVISAVNFALYLVVARSYTVKKLVRQ